MNDAPSDNLPVNPPTWEEMQMHMQTLMTEIQALRTENEGARTIIEQLRTQQPVPPSPSTATIPLAPGPLADPYTVRTNRPRPLLPDVTPYTHEDSTLYPAFILNLEMKWKIDGAVHVTSEEKVIYGFGKLQGKAIKKILPWLEARLATKEPLRTEEFRSVMDKAFRDPDVRIKALAKLNRIKQGSHDLLDFLPEFDQIIMEAGALQWDDEAKIAYLQAALNRDLLLSLVAAPMETSYEGYCRQILRVNENQRRLLRSKSWINRTSPVVSHQPSTQKVSDTMDWEATTTKAAASRTHPKGSSKPPAKWVTPEMLAKRREDRGCIRCGLKDHFVRDCTYGPAKRPERVAAVRTVKTQRGDHVEGEESSDTEGSESGN